MNTPLYLNGSQTLVMGPVDDAREPADAGLWVVEIRGLKAVIDCDTPSARMNCSRSSMLVRPLAVHWAGESGERITEVHGFQSGTVHFQDQTENGIQTK